MRAISTADHPSGCRRRASGRDHAVDLGMDVNITRCGMIIVSARGEDRIMQIDFGGSRAASAMERRRRSTGQPDPLPADHDDTMAALLGACPSPWPIGRAAKRVSAWGCAW